MEVCCAKLPTRTKNARFLAVITLCVVALLLVVAQAGAHPFDLRGQDWEGCADFVELARTELGERVVVTNVIDLHELKPEDGIIMLYPEKSVDDEGLSQFMRAGGRVILLDDFGSGDALLTHFQMERVPIPQHPAESLRQNPNLAIAEPASMHPVVAGVSRVVTNHAIGLSHPELSPILKIRGRGEPDVVIAVAGAVQQGRLLVVGDPSIVINSMLRYSGNKEFGRGLIRYAVEDDAWGKRGGKLYIASGKFEERGSFDDESSFGTQLREEMRALRDLVYAARAGNTPPMLLFIFAIAVALGLGGWLFARAGRLHKATTPRFSRAIPLIAQGGVAGHAAVIASKHTSRVLALFELKSALEERLASLLGLEELPPQPTLFTKVEAAGLLTSSELAVMKSVCGRLAEVETIVISSRPEAFAKVKDDEVKRIARIIFELLGAAEGRKKA
jgi:hypothetical protein